MIYVIQNHPTGKRHGRDLNSGILSTPNHSLYHAEGRQESVEGFTEQQLYDKTLRVPFRHQVSGGEHLMSEVIVDKRSDTGPESHGQM